MTDCIRHLDAQGFTKPLVHLIDREGDSVGHIRRWDATGNRWLVRVKYNPKADYAIKPTACKTVAQAEATLSRPAKPSHLCPVKIKANNPLSPAFRCRQRWWSAVS